MIEFIVDWFVFVFQWLLAIVVVVCIVGPIYCLLILTLPENKLFRAFASWWVDTWPHTKKPAKDKIFGTNCVQNAIELPKYLNQFKDVLYPLERGKDRWGAVRYDKFREKELKDVADLFKHIHELGLQVYFRGIESSDDTGVRFKHRSTKFPYRYYKIFPSKEEKELISEEMSGQIEPLDLNRESFPIFF